MSAERRKKVDSRHALYRVYGTWCREQNTTTRGFGGVLYQVCSPVAHFAAAHASLSPLQMSNHEMKRLVVVRGTEIVWTDLKPVSDRRGSGSPTLPR